MSHLHTYSVFVEALEVRALMSQTAPVASAEPLRIDVRVAAANVTTSVVGKWRTAGKINYSGNGMTLLSGDGPSWVNFRKGGRVVTDMNLPLLWKQSGQTVTLSLDLAEVKAQLGGRSISWVSYKTRTAKITGNAIRGSFDCSFTVAFGGTSVRARLVWTFSGKRW